MPERPPVTADEAVRAGLYDQVADGGRLDRTRDHGQSELIGDRTICAGVAETGPPRSRQDR